MGRNYELEDALSQYASGIYGGGMKQKPNGRDYHRYGTRVATYHRHEYGHSSGYDVALHRLADGNYILYGDGGHHTPWGDEDRVGDWRSGKVSIQREAGDALLELWD